MIHTQEKNQPIEAVSEMTEVMELADKELKISIVNNMLEDIKENMSMMKRDRKDFYFKKNKRTGF